MLEYIAAPYTHSDPNVTKDRMNKFCQFMADRISAGFYPVSPLMNDLLVGRADTNFPLDWEYWQGFSKTMLKKCDSMIVLTFEGWEESEGVTAEIELAKELGIKTVYAEVN